MIWIFRAHLCLICKSLRRALRSAAEQEFTVFVGFHPRAEADLCVRALEAEIEVGTAQELVRRCRLVPTDPPLAVEA